MSDRTPRPRARRRAAQGGFTLVELLMGIILASIFAVALFAFFFSGADQVRSQESQARAQMSARSSLDRIARDARQAISPDDGLTPPVISLTPTSIEVYVDPSRVASATVPRPQKVRYSIVSGQLVREAVNPVGATFPYTYGSYGRREVLIDAITNTSASPAFRAVTRTGLVLPATPSATQLRDVAQISIRLLLSQKTGNANSTLEMNTDVALRNAGRL